MKNKILLSLIFVIVVVTSSFDSLKNNDTYENLLGKWNYEALNAPYEYQKGEIVFQEENDELTGYIKIGEYKITLEDIKVEDNNVTFYAFIDGTTVNFDMLFDGGKMTGTATYSEGSVDVTGTKKS